MPLKLSIPRSFTILTAMHRCSPAWVYYTRSGEELKPGPLRVMSLGRLAAEIGWPLTPG
jgi:hypothetical protein